MLLPILHRYFAAIPIACLAIGSAYLCPAIPPLPPLVQQIDHTVLNCEDPEATFRLFSEKLNLPVVWPFQSYGTFSSGGVSLGNVNLEIVHASSHKPTGFSGVAFDPGSLSAAVRGLDARSLPHGAPQPFFQRQELFWTTLTLPQLAPVATVFLCKYNFDIEGTRTKAKRQLQQTNGGPLGVELVTELVIGVQDITTAQRDWHALLGQSAARNAVWSLGAGPGVRLTPADADHIQQIRVKVKSLRAARTFLKTEGLLGVDNTTEIALAPIHVAGPGIYFRQDLVR